MTVPLIRARKKPHFDLPWLALLLGLSTAGFALAGVQAMTATRTSQLEIVFEGTDHPYGISAESVAAVMPGPIATWQPLRLLVTDRFLTHGEVSGTASVGADAVLSTKLQDLHSPALPGTGTLPEHFSSGAGIYGHSTGEARRDRLQVEEAYLGNISLGHGPKAVAAAAARTDEVIDRGPLQEIVFWLVGTALGLVLTIAALAWSLSRRRRREHLFQRLTAAQSQLAGVVLELEALEVSYAGAERQGGKAGLDTTWSAIRLDSLALARTEDAAMAAVYGAGTALQPATEAMVSDFERTARRLALQSDALMDASTVWGGLAGSSRVLEQLATPIELGGRELLAQLRDRPSYVLAEHRIKRLTAALDALLKVPGSGLGSSAAIAAWGRAETDLLNTVTAIARVLEKRAKVRVPSPASSAADYSQLRRSLGLAPNLSRDLLAAMDKAKAALPLAVAQGLSHGSVPAAKPSQPEAERTPPGSFLRKNSPYLVGILVVSMLAGSAITVLTEESVVWDTPKPQPPASLSFDGDTSGLDEAGIREGAAQLFTQPVHITVAVREASDYLGIVGNFSGQFGYEKREPQQVFDALWHIKGEFPELLDAPARELLTDHAIVPVFRDAAGSFAAPTVIAGAVARGDMSRLNTKAVRSGAFTFSTDGDRKVTSTIRDLAYGLQGNDIRKPAVSAGVKFWLWTSTLALSLMLAGLAAIYASAMSTRLGRFGRSAARLRLVDAELDGLLLGLDESRINAVAILGAGPAATSAETGQRVFESALAMACRRRDALAASTLSQRLNATYVAEVERLAELVAVLSIRELDVEHRSEKLLAASRGFSVRHQG